MLNKISSGNNNSDQQKIFDPYNISHFSKKDQKEFLEIFVKDIEEKIKKIKINYNNTKELEHLFHSLKGSSGNIGAYLLQEYVKKIEQSLKDGDLLKSIDWLNELQGLYQEFAVQIKLFLDK